MIPYDRLLAALDVATLRELEDLVIDALYRNIFVGKLDHARAQLQVKPPTSFLHVYVKSGTG